MVKKIPDHENEGFGTRVGGYVRQNKGKSAAIFAAFLIAVAVIASL